MNNDILEAVNAYLDSKDELAFQINGEWGTGKTYFIQNKIISGIKDTNLESNNTCYKRIPVYVSLNGINSIEELETKINRGVLAAYKVEVGDPNNISGKIGAGFEFISKLKIPFFNSDFSEETRRSINAIRDHFLENDDFSNYIIFLDDLERIAPKVSMEEVFGCIADLQNKWQCKVIIISDENHISDAKQLVFRKLKEKVINKSVQFGSESIEVATNLINMQLKELKLDKDVLEWMLDKTQILFEKSKNINLRTIKSFMSTFCQFYDVVETQQDKTKSVQNQCLKSGFLSLYVLTETFKKGLLHDVNSVKQLFPGVINTNDLFRDSDASQEESDAIKFIKENYESRAQSFTHDLIYDEALTNLVLHGNLNIQDFLGDINARFFREWDEADRISNELHNFRQLTDIELKHCQLEAWRLVSDIKTKARWMLETYTYFKLFKENNILLIDISVDEFQNYLVKKIDILGWTDLDFFETIIKSPEFNYLDTSLRQSINSRRKTLQKQNDKEIIQDLLSGNFYGADSDVVPFQTESFFELLIVNNDYWDKLLQSNVAIQNVEKYLSSIPRGNKVNELKFANQFIGKVNDFVRGDNNLGRIQAFNLNELTRKINDIKYMWR